MRNFQAGVDFLNELAALAEREGHHPDFQLAGYRNVTIELWTHAIGGLSENDFILAAKISALPIALRHGAGRTPAIRGGERSIRSGRTGRGSA